MQPQFEETQSVFSMIWERRKLAFAVASLAMVGGLAYTYFAPSVWEAKATIVFPVRTPSLLGAGNFEQQGLAATLTGGPTPLKIFAGMIESERALEYVSKKSGVSRRKIREMRNLSEASMASSITISAKNTNADLAKNIVAYHLEALKEINDAVSKPLISSDATTIKAQLDEQKKKLAAAEAELQKFQEHALTAPSYISAGSGKDSTIIPTQGRWADMLKQLELQFTTLDATIRDAENRSRTIAAKVGDLPAALPPVEKWRGRLTDMQYELKIKEITLAEDAPELKKLRKTIEITEGQLQNEMDKYLRAAQNGMVDIAGASNRMPTYLTQRVALEAQISAVRRLAKMAPSESIRLSQLTRDVTTASAIVGQLTGQYELATLQSDRNPNNWQVLDEPEVDDKPVNKSLTKNLTLSAIGGLALGSLVALFAPRRRKPTAKSEPELVIEKAA